MSTVVNLYGGSGTGKSTTMAAVFSLMKMRGMSVEMAPEWVKLPVWAGENHVLDDQLYIFAKQNRQLRRLNGKVDYIITDAPLLMSLVYGHDPFLNQLVSHVSRGYLNVHLFLNRVKRYYPEGRTQDEDQARNLDVRIWAMLRREFIGKIQRIDADDKAAIVITDLLTT
ncbi:MAG: AAA family ATPase [Gemmatimonadota bacterium]